MNLSAQDIEMKLQGWRRVYRAWLEKRVDLYGEMCREAAEFAEEAPHFADESECQEAEAHLAHAKTLLEAARRTLAQQHALYDARGRERGAKL